MSNHARRRGSTRAESFAALRRVTITTAKAFGCTCDPIIRRAPDEDGVRVVKVSHDAACPMANYGSTYTAYNEAAWRPHGGAA